MFLSIMGLLNVKCSSSDDSPPINPKKDILGKWELVKQGTSLNNLTNLKSRGYVECLDDKSYRFYNYNTQKFSYGDYSMDDSSLTYYYYAVGNNQVIDAIPERYFYTFTNKRRLILDIDALAMQNIFIYNKIE